MTSFAGLDEHLVEWIRDNIRMSHMVDEHKLQEFASELVHCGGRNISDKKLILGRGTLICLFLMLFEYFLAHKLLGVLNHHAKLG